jgi:hypothetical protein
MPVIVMASGSPSGSVTPATDTGTSRWFGGQSRSGTANAPLQSGVWLPPGIVVDVVEVEDAVVVLEVVDDVVDEVVVGTVIVVDVDEVVDEVVLDDVVVVVGDVVLEVVEDVVDEVVLVVVVVVTAWQFVSAPSMSRSPSLSRPRKSPTVQFSFVLAVAVGLHGMAALVSAVP